MGSFIVAQVVLEVIDENVAQGSRVYEEGHVSLPTKIKYDALLLQRAVDCRHCAFTVIASRHAERRRIRKMHLRPERPVVGHTLHVSSRRFERGAAAHRSWCSRGQTTGRIWRWCGSCSARCASHTAATAGRPSSCSAAARSWSATFCAHSVFQRIDAAFRTSNTHPLEPAVKLGHGTLCNCYARRPLN